MNSSSTRGIQHSAAPREAKSWINTVSAFAEPAKRLHTSDTLVYRWSPWKFILFISFCLYITAFRKPLRKPYFMQV